MVEGTTKQLGTAEDPLDAVFTLPNAISFVRLCMVPAFFVALVSGQERLATLLFALAACTDFIDGQVARRTHTVSRLGRVLDPAVDRLLMVMGVLGILIIGRLPLWIVAIVVVRDVVLGAGYLYMLRAWDHRIDVIFPGKVCTTLLFTGFVMIILNWPMISGLGVTDLSWLPGLNEQACSLGIWLVYAGLILGMFTTGYYIREAICAWRARHDVEAL